MITCGWVIAGIVQVASLAGRAALRRIGERPSPRPERGRALLAALAVTAIAIPLLLWGWRAWPQSAVALGLTFIVPVGWRKVIESGNWLVFRLAALALGILIYEGALIWEERGVAFSRSAARAGGWRSACPRSP